MSRGRGCSSAQAAANGRKGKLVYERKKKQIALEYGPVSASPHRPVDVAVIKPAIKLVGGRPFYREHSLDAWPKLKEFPE